ncbi:putative kinesin light chain [Aspergillus undulatus]|uniref:putative kinesin light chain n=1 Tax=Aspergillus undulatus TaxID=1810928 RepID=UPI003CCCD6D9
MRPKSRNDFTIAIICALPLEAEAVEALFDKCYDRLGKYYGKHRGDTNAYINGRIGRHNVVLCYMPGMGKGSAASVASSLQFSYTGIELALVVGICGGAPPPPNYEEIFLGDVIISDSVIEYDFGRQYPGGFQRKTGLKDTLGRPGREIRTLLNGLRAENARSELQNQAQQYLYTLQQTGTKWYHPRLNDMLFKASYLHKHSHYASSARCSCFGTDSPDQICEDALGKDCDELNCDKGQQIRCREFSEEAIQTSIYIGPVASADTVMKSGQYRDEIVRKERVVGFEMEGAGVWDNIPCIIVKGVCDYADSHKSKSWQAYAAATGASAAKAFLEYWKPTKHEDARKNRHLMIPFGRNPCFVGRQDEIHKLEELILMPGGDNKLAITGLGGVGKTQVALELAYRMRDRDATCSIFWIPCNSHEAVEQAYMAIAQMVGIPDVKPANVKEDIKAYFSHKEGKWLLIFDNADDIEMWTKGSNNTLPLKDFLPFNDQGHIIFTSRNRELAVDLVSSCVIHIGALDKKTGVEFLEQALVRKDLLDDSPAAIALLEQLTFLPLAISQATAYINKKGITVSDYLMLLKEQESDVVELLSKDFGDDRRYKDIQNLVAKTWLISFYQGQKQDQLAAEYLSFMACFNPRNIPQTLLPRSGSRVKMTDALGLLSAYSFITVQPGNRFITLHRLVHLATRNWIRNEGQFPAYISKAADRLSEIFPNNNHTNRQLWREYLPHALSLLSEREVREQQEQYIDCIENVGSCLYSDGRYNEAEELEVQVMETRKQVLGPEHPSTLTSMGNLAFTWESLGNIPAALALMGRCVELRNKVLGSGHPDTISSSNTLKEWETAHDTRHDRPTLPVHA